MAIRPDIDTSTDTVSDIADTVNAILDTIGDRGVIPSFAVALTTDLSQFEVVEVESDKNNWEQTAGGPVGQTRYHKTGVITPGSAGTGTRFQWYDVLGNEFVLSKQIITPLMVGAVGDGVTDDTAIISEIEASSVDWVYLPEGYTFKTTLVSVSKTYYGPGDIDLNGLVVDYDFFRPDKALHSRSAIVAGQLTVDGHTELNSTLNVDGDVDFHSHVDINSTVTIQGQATMNSHVEMNSTLNVDGDATFQGNVTIYGTTTDVNTQNMVVEDNIITLNNGEPGPGIQGGGGKSGFEVDRGPGQGRFQLVFDDVDDKPKISLDTGSTYTNLATEPFAQNAADTAVSQISFAGSIQGFYIRNSTGDIDHDIVISSGEATDQYGNVKIRASSGKAKSIDSIWTPGSFTGGLAVAPVQPNTWYHVFVIKNTSTGDVDAGFDTSSDAANLLSTSGYHVARRVGSVRTDGAANIIQFNHLIGTDFYYWSNPPSDAYSNVGAATTIPILAPEFQMAKLNLFFDDNSGSSVAVHCLVEPTIVPHTTPSGSHSTLASYSSGSYNYEQSVEMDVNVGINREVRISSTNGSNNTLIVRTIGFYDSRAPRTDVS